MKSLLITSLLCTTLLFAGGCSKERQVDAPSGRTAIRLGTSVRGSIEASTRADTPGPLSTTVGIFAYAYSSSDAWVTSPVIYTNASATVGVFADGANPLTLPLKYYVPGATHAFYAYSPWVDGLTAAAPTFDNDMFTEQTDWLWCKKAGVLLNTNPLYREVLTLNHTMSMVNFAIKKEENIATVLTLEKIEITTSNSQKFTFDVSTGTVTSQAGGTLAFAHTALDYTVPTVYGTAMAQTLLLPSSVITKIAFTINGETYETPVSGWSLTTDVKGTFKLIEVNIKETEIVITIGGQEWKPGEDTDLTNGSVTISIGDGGWAYEPGSDTDLRQGSATISVGSQGWKDGGTNDLRPQP